MDRISLHLNVLEILDNLLCKRVMFQHIQSRLKNFIFVQYRIGNLLDNACIHTYISSRLDYCNCISYDCPSYENQKLQSVQNAAARLVSHSKKYDHITPILKE